MPMLRRSVLENVDVEQTEMTEQVERDQVIFADKVHQSQQIILPLRADKAVQ